MKSATNFFTLTRGARRVLVIDPGMLGDAVHRLPVLWELRRNYPQAEIHALCSPVGAEVLGMAGCVDKLWVLDQARERRTLAGQWHVLSALRRLRFDVSINFGDNDRNVIHAGLVGARHRLGLRRDRWHFWSRWCIQHWVRSPGRGLPVYEQRRQMLAAVGFPLAELRFELHPPEEARLWAKTCVPADAIHFSLSASTHLKEWPLPQWIELAQRLWNKRPETKIIITAAPSEREQRRLSQFVAAFTADRPGTVSQLHTFTGLSIPQLTALLARCSLHVGADSGVLHLAAALGVPTVGLFRRYPRLAEWLPRGAAHRHLIADCDCVQQRSNLCAQREVALCLAALAPADAEAAILKSAIPSTPIAARLSIAICSRNRAASLERAIRSVLAQTDPDDEIVVVDDGSTDDTPRRLAALAKEHPGLRCYRTEAVGIAAARNHALAQARSDHVLFLDDDETAEPGWLVAYRAFLAAPPGPCVGAVGGPYLAEFEQPPPPWLDETFGSYDHRGEMRALDGCLALPGGNCLFVKAAVEKVGGFATDLERGEDSELNLRLRDAGYETWWMPAARIRHHIPPDRMHFGSRMALAFADGRSVARLRLRRCGPMGKRWRFAVGRCLVTPFQVAAMVAGAGVLASSGRTRRATFDLTRAMRAAGIAWELIRHPRRVFSAGSRSQK